MLPVRALTLTLTQILTPTLTLTDGVIEHSDILARIGGRVLPVRALTDENVFGIHPIILDAHVRDSQRAWC